jgi:hypothetical protein
MPRGNCKHEGCTGAVAGKGYCARHYRKWRRGELPKARYKICTHEGCRKARHAGSKCAEHAGKAAAQPAAAAT